MKIHKALKLAIRYLEKESTILDLDYKLTANWVEDKWVFWIQSKPLTPGKDVTILVWPDKKVEEIKGF